MRGQFGRAGAEQKGRYAPAKPRNRGILQYLIINYKKLRIDMQRVRGEK